MAGYEVDKLRGDTDVDKKAKLLSDVIETELLHNTNWSRLFFGDYYTN